MAQLTQVPHAGALSLQRRPTWISNSLWGVMWLFSLAIAGYGTTYFLALPNNQHFARYIVPLRLHIAGGMGALLAGPWQFSQRLRARALNLHRWMGRFYLLEVALGSTAGMAMAVVSMEGMPTHLGFGILAVLWFVTGLQAYLAVRRGDIDAHRRWMIRNFALTLAAVTLRVYMPLMLAAMHWPFRPSYIAVSWMCWIPNVMVAEWMARSRARVAQSTA